MTETHTGGPALSGKNTLDWFTMASGISLSMVSTRVCGNAGHQSQHGLGIKYRRRTTEDIIGPSSTGRRRTVVEDWPHDWYRTETRIESKTSCNF
jgi:hypothetical protein